MLTCAQTAATLCAPSPGLEPLIKNIRVMMKAQGSWEKSSEYYILREVRAALAARVMLNTGGTCAADKHRCM